MIPACPDCGSNLGKGAIKCRCGWKAPIAVPRLTKPCAYENCTTPAFIRVQTPLGWAEFCDYHEREYHHERSELACRERGLYTLEQRKEYCRRLLGKWLEK